MNRVKVKYMIINMDFFYGKNITGTKLTVSQNYKTQV